MGKNIDIDIDDILFRYIEYRNRYFFEYRPVTINRLYTFDRKAHSAAVADAEVCTCFVQLALT